MRCTTFTLIATIAALLSIRPVGPKTHTESPDFDTSWIAPSVESVADQLKTDLESRPSPRLGVAGMRVYKNPKTGQLEQSPPDGFQEALSEEMRKAFTTTSEGLEVEPSPVPGGGTIIRFNGRFQSAFVSNIRSDGVQVTECAGPDPTGSGVHLPVDTNGPEGR